MTTRNWLRSSDTVATRNLMVTELPIERIASGVDYLKHEEVNELFDSKMVSSGKVLQFMQQLPYG